MTKLRTTLLISTVLLAACNNLKVPVLSPYKMDIRQGNFVTPEMREKVQLGMSKQQAQNLLGTPMINDAFHGNRWDYVYSLEKEGKIVDKQRLALYFSDDKLVRIDDNGNLTEVESNYAATMRKTPSVVASAAVEEIALDSVPAEPVVVAAASVPAVPAVPTATSTATPEPAVEEVALNNVPQEESKTSIAQTPAPAPEPEPVATATAPLVQNEAPAVANLPPATPVETPSARTEDEPAPIRVAASSGSDRTDVMDSVQTWVNTWTARNVPKYLANYAPHFQPAGMSRSAWEAQRRLRLGKAKSIDVDLKELQVVVQDSNHATATFKQDYRSDSYRDSTLKGLKLEKVSGKWLIVAEQELKSLPAPVVEREETRVADVAAPTPATPSNKPRGKVETPDEIVQRVEHWEAAWSARDIDGYLASYASNFKPNDGLDRAAWEAQRKARISKAKSIQVTLSDVNIRVLDESRANVHFKQQYRSDSYRDRSQKTLQLQKVGGEWLIVAETEHRI